MWNICLRTLKKCIHESCREILFTHETHFKHIYFTAPWSKLAKTFSYLPQINSFKSAETVSVRRCCSLSPDRHEIRQKRKWLVGGGWCQPGGSGGLEGAPSPSAAERRAGLVGIRTNHITLKISLLTLPERSVISAIPKTDRLVANKLNSMKMFRACYFFCFLYTLYVSKWVFWSNSVFSTKIRHQGALSDNSSAQFVKLRKD